MISKSAIKMLEIHSFASSACRIYPCKGATWAVTITLERLNLWPALALADRDPLVGRAAADRVLDPVERGDARNHLAGDWRLGGLVDLIELAPCMAPAEREDEGAGLLVSGEPLEAAPAIDLQHPGKAGELGLGAGHRCGPRYRHKPRPVASPRPRAGRRGQSPTGSRSLSCPCRAPAPADGCRHRRSSASSAQW